MIPLIYIDTINSYNFGIIWEIHKLFKYTQNMLNLQMMSVFSKNMKQSARVLCILYTFEN